MVFRQDSSGRVQPTEYRNLLQPGTCALCSRIGRYPEEVFANLGVELEYYGIVYLCPECCAEIADFIMFKSPERYDELTDRHIKLAHDYDVAMAELTRTRMLLNARIDSFISGESDSDGAVSLSVPEAERQSVESDSVIDSDEPESAESGAKY